MRSRKGSGQEEEHEQTLRGKKYGGLGEIQVLLIEPKVTSVAGDEMMVPDYGGVWEFILCSYFFKCDL